MNLKIKIPFDENTFVRQCITKWTLVNHKNKRNIKSILIGWTIAFTIGVLAGIREGQYINGLTIAGLIFIVYGLWMLISLIQGKKKYIKEVTEIGKDFKIKNDTCDYEFTDEYFRCVDKQRDIKLNWDVFKSYTLKDTYIVINQSDSFEYSYILGEKELSTDNYLSIKIFLSDKLKLKEV